MPTAHAAVRRSVVQTAVARTTVALLVLALALPAGAQPQVPDPYNPSVGQAGKDVVWVPTPDAVVTKMLEAVKTTKDDIVYDLGSGDGKIPIAAAKVYGAKATGIEYNPEMAEFARRNVKRAGVEQQVNIITGDIFVEDFSKATVVTMYLLPQLNVKLRPTILAMKPGTRVTSHQFDMGDWEPDQHLQIDTRDAFVWIVPAPVAGEWSLKDEREVLSATLNLVQRYQRLGGTITVAGKTQPLLGAWMDGDKLGFSFVDGEGALQAVRMTAVGSSMAGTLSDSRRTAVTASKR